MQRSAQDDVATEVRGRLGRLAKLGHCADTIRGRFTNKKQGAVRELYIVGLERSETEPLFKLADLDSATLTVLALQRGAAVEKFTVMLQGRAKGDVDWTVAVHLDPEALGDGACGHALIHCHVGPTLDHAPKVRVPFPAVTLPHALDWVLTQVIPSWEPAPWASLPAEVRRR